MTFEVLVEPGATGDIADADAFLAEVGVADEFLAALDRLFERLEDRPLMYPLVYGSVRRALIARFAYAVFFTIEEQRVVVLAVQHQRRDPAARPVR